MTDEPFDVEALRADVREKIGAHFGCENTTCRSWNDALGWVLSLLPDPPPKYEVVPRSGNETWDVVEMTTDLIWATYWGNHPDAEQRAHEECARLNGREHT